MASITRCGTCVPPGPSKKTAGHFLECSLTDWASAGNCARTQARSRGVEVTEEVCSAMGMTNILMGGRVGGGVVLGQILPQRLKPMFKGAVYRSAETTCGKTHECLHYRERAALQG